MKTVRPLGVVVCSFLMAFALSGCGSLFSLNRTASVEFTQNGEPLRLSTSEYLALRGEVRALLAKKKLDLVDSPLKSQMIARVELQTMGAAPKRTVAGMRVTRVLANFASRGAGRPESSPSLSGDSHASLGLARSLDNERSAGDSPTAGR